VLVDMDRDAGGMAGALPYALSKGSNGGGGAFS